MKQSTITVTHLTTEMVRIALGKSTRRHVSPLSRSLSLLWMVGALAVFVAYLLLPILLLSQHLHILFLAILLAIALTIGEAVVWAIVWATSHPALARSSRVPVLVPQQSTLPDPAILKTLPLVADLALLETLPATPLPASSLAADLACFETIAVTPPPVSLSERHLSQNLSE